jgi:hypothetical protein
MFSNVLSGFIFCCSDRTHVFTLTVLLIPLIEWVVTELG